MTPLAVAAHDVLTFWFEQSGKDRWFSGDAGFDAEIRARFLTLQEEAAAGRHDDWAASPLGAVALCIVLDQFPRNLFRGTPRAFATDPQALATAKAAVEQGFDKDPALTDDHRLFLYLPFEHSEDLADQQRSVELQTAGLSDPGYIDYARRHLAVIERFGRFPHRNLILGRITTPEEEAYLAEHGGF
ncbi:DUF924 family protein [Inquilinus limosus]|uniref:DUF924 family protein n=1 Tax=Inquilinus limosus TaxID=171674 RepID=UPI00040AF3FD|nr:DUF924 family protein [Inquilinus limosus]